MILTRYPRAIARRLRAGMREMLAPSASTPAQSGNEVTKELARLRARTDQLTHAMFADSLAAYRGIHQGQRCFVVGNGPSLNQIDMTLLRDEITMGSNRVFLGFERWGYDFKYWMTQDETNIKQIAEDYVENVPDDVIKFVPIRFLENFDLTRFQNCCPVNLELDMENYPLFSDHPRAIFEGWTVTYSMLQIAVIMGCNPIYLIGVDYNYQINKDTLVNDTRWTDSESKSHFHPDYCKADAGVIWNIPRFDRTDKAYACAADYAKANGVEIINATPGSKLTAFPTIDYEDLFPASGRETSAA